MTGRKRGFKDGIALALEEAVAVAEAVGDMVTNEVAVGLAEGVIITHDVEAGYDVSPAGQGKQICVAGVNEEDPKKPALQKQPEPLHVQSVPTVHAPLAVIKTNVKSRKSRRNNVDSLRSKKILENI